MRYNEALWLRLDTKQLEQIDRFRTSSGRRTMTSALRHLIQKGLQMEQRRAAKERAVAVLSVLHECDGEALRRLADIQRKAGGVILSQTRSHLDAHTCMSVFALRGPERRIRELLEAFHAMAGVTHAWISECPEKAASARDLRRALSGAMAENGWACTQRDMVMTMPLILTCGAELLWKQLLTTRTDGHHIAVSFSVRISREAFLHVAVLKRAAGSNLSVFPLSPGKKRALSDGDGSAPSALIGNS
jgi:CopG family nickel-responsive transcriptional regulator